jgi:sigma-B regulation protein RsbQ
MGACGLQKEPHMNRIKRDGAEIGFEVSGSGDATLLFVHGSYIDQGWWKAQVDYFRQDYRVVTLDLPGHGKSGRDRGHWTLKGFAEDICAVMDALKASDVVLIGHSMAADINLLVADMRPEAVAGFIAIEAFKNAGTALAPEFRNQAKAILESLETDFMGTNERWARMALLTPATPPAITERVVSAYRDAYRPMGQAIMPTVFAMYGMERVLMPILGNRLFLINVDYVPTNEDTLAQYARNGFEVIRIPGTCHFPMLENPETLNAALEQVLGKIRREIPMLT